MVRLGSLRRSHFTNKFFLDDLSNESVEQLRQKLNAMKKLVAERQQHSNSTPGSSFN